MADLPKSAKYYSDLPEEENVYDADYVFVLDNGNGARVTTEKFVDTVANKAGVHDMVSDEFDEGKEYSAGDYCIYENTLYKFTEDKEAGKWDTEIVEATTVSGEIQENTDLIESLSMVDMTTIDNQSISSNTYAQYDIDVSREGYSVLGQVGICVINASDSGTGASSVFPYQIYPTTDGTAIHVAVRNMSSSAVKIQIRVYVLYQKD